jgi:hypothetical protein
MSGQTEATRQSDYITPPRKGGISVVAVTSTSAATTMATYGQVTYTAGTTISYGSHYWNFQADGNDVYIAFSNATLTVDDTATGALAATLCAKIPNGTTLQVKLSPATDVYIGVKTASGTANLRIWQSSP